MNMQNFQRRVDNKIDSILQEKEMIKLERAFPFSIDGVDKEGRPSKLINGLWKQGMPIDTFFLI